MSYVFAMLAAGGALIAVAAWAILGGRDNLEVAGFAAAVAVTFLVAGWFKLIR